MFRSRWAAEVSSLDMYFVPQLWLNEQRDWRKKRWRTPVKLSPNSGATFSQSRGSASPIMETLVLGAGGTLGKMMQLKHRLQVTQNSSVNLHWHVSATFTLSWPWLIAVRLTRVLEESIQCFNYRIQSFFSRPRLPQAPVDAGAVTTELNT